MYNNVTLKQKSILPHPCSPYLHHVFFAEHNADCFYKDGKSNNIT